MSPLFCHILNSFEQNTFFNKVPIFDELISSFSNSLTLLIFIRIVLISSTHDSSLLNNSCCSLLRASKSFNFRGLPLFFLTVNKFVLRSEIGASVSFSLTDCESFAFFRASASADLNFGADDLFLNNFQLSSSKSFMESLLISALKMEIRLLQPNYDF